MVFCDGILSRLTYLLLFSFFCLKWRAVGRLRAAQDTKKLLIGPALWARHKLSFLRSCGNHFPGKSFQRDDREGLRALLWLTIFQVPLVTRVSLGIFREKVPPEAWEILTLECIDSSFFNESGGDQQTVITTLKQKWGKTNGSLPRKHLLVSFKERGFLQSL